jgi:hypothetical protein
MTDCKTHKSARIVPMMGRFGGAKYGGECTVGWIKFVFQTLILSRDFQLGSFDVRIVC